MTQETIVRRGGLFPKTLSSQVEKLTREPLKKRGLAGSRIISDWEKIVGAELATHSIPTKLNFANGKTVDGTLTIQVAGNFAPYFQHMEPIILDRIAAYFGYRAVSRIVYVQAPLPSSPVINRPTRSTLAKHDVEKIIAAVEDPALKAALQSLGEYIPN